MRALWLACVGAMGLLVLGPRTTTADDDLDLVKRAVAKKEGPDRGQPSPRARRVNVRVVDKGTGKTKISLTLPLALVEILDDWPVDVCSGGRHRLHRHHRGCSLSEILAALESGEDLVQIDDDHASVRVWVE